MKTRYRTGVWGEARAALYLFMHGMRIVKWRYRAAGGEIDLIARDKKILVFAEVKFRPKGRAGAGILAVDADKQRRMVRAANAYLTRFRVLPCARFDIVEITRDGVRHEKNAFYA